MNSNGPPHFEKSPERADEGYDKVLALVFRSSWGHGPTCAEQSSCTLFFGVLQGGVGLIAELWKCHAGGHQKPKVSGFLGGACNLSFLQVGLRCLSCAQQLNSGKAAGAAPERLTALP